jgi:predicted 3-demethylubiquinone-9 3-methyltransferase (glyoxalase superfamily)
MAIAPKIAPCLWFDDQAEEAAKFYVSIFDNSSIGTVSRYGKEGFEVHGRPEGSAMTVSFRLDGQEFTALNGGPQFKFTEAISFVVKCQPQAEVDRYWDKLTRGGDERAQQCGWLKDKFGLMANRSDRLVRDVGRCRQEKIRSSYASDAADEEIGFAGIAPGIRGEFLNGQ